MTAGAPEQLAVTLARLARDGEVACHGVNSFLASLALALARRLHAPRLRHIAIGGGLDAEPPALPRSSSGAAWLQGSPVALSNVDVYQLALRGRIDLMMLSCVQVDGQARLNSTVIGPFERPRVRLPGGGGAAVLAQVVRRIVVYRTRHDPGALPEKVDFVTATGRVEHVVTPLGVFRATSDGLRLEGVQPGATLEMITRQTGFPVIPTDDCHPVAPPSPAELAAIFSLDPDRTREADFQ